MARRTRLFPVNKPYHKVQRDLDTSHSSSIGKPDFLSYSYSCVQEFKKNQHIIKNLAILHEDNEYQGLSHQPELFTLSGERENPVCQPFYCSTASNTDRTETADLFETSNRPMPSFGIEEIIQSSTNTISDSGSILFDKNVLLQWLKYQFKYVNSWWPFSKSKDYFFTRLCKKEKSMKMEMMLNNVDEETKYKIKRYVAELNLNLEERYNLCNESVIEIDITPIFSDTRRLQAFLLFLNNIESNNPKLINSQPQKHYEYPKNNLNFTEGAFVNQVTKGRSLFQTNALNTRNKFNKENNSVIENKVDNSRKDEKNVFVHPNLFNENSNYTQRNFHNKKMNDCNNRNRLTSSSVSEYRRKHLRVDIKSNQKVGKKTRLKSTIAVNEPKGEIDHDSITNTVGGNVPQTTVKRTMCNETVHCVQTHYRPTSHQPIYLKNPETTDHDSLVKNKLSCKCLMHQQREDFHRYKHQCLFGRGDETTNNLIKFVVVNENKYLSSCENKEVANPVSDKAFKIQNKSKAKSLNTEESYDRNIKRKTSQHLLEKYNSQPTVKNKTLARNSNKNYEKHYSKPLAINNSSTTENIFLNHKFNSSKELQSSDYISDTITCDSFVDKLCFHTGHRQVVHIDDVDKLLCAIDYNKDGFSSKQADSFQNSIKTDRLEESSNEYSNNLSFNACFESLNYSINSVTRNAASETVNSLTEVDSESESQGESTVFFKKGFSGMLANTQENKTLRSQAVGNKNIIVSDREKTLKNNFMTTRATTGFEKRGFNMQTLGAEEYFKEFIYQDLKQISNDLFNYKKAPSCNNLDENTKQKINLFVSNAKELQTKMAHLSRKLRLKGQKRDINDKTNNTASDELSKMNMVIKISGLDIRKKTEDKQLKSRKRSFSSFSPTNIYQSISSIFKGTHDCDPTKEKHQEYIAVPKRKTSVTDFERDGKHVKYDKLMNNSLIKNNNTNTNQTKNTSVSSVTLSPEKLDYLIFNNLEKLNSELKSQRNEIDALKSLMLKRKKH